MAFRKGARGAVRAELDLAQLLQRYCRQFIQTDPQRAFQYYLLLTLVPTDGAAVRPPALLICLGRGCGHSPMDDQTHHLACFLIGDCAGTHAPAGA